ncbi:MAG: N-acetylmuramoyl-L-alanine amidase [bacterium]|nr:N-acetylmuramoyl-L-alanine amidase [bacterium]
MAMPRQAAVRFRGHPLAAALAVAFLLVAGAAVAADGARILRLRHFTGPEHTRIVVDLDRACSYEVRRVEGPDRIAVNLQGAVFVGGGDRAVGDGLVERIRCNAGDGRAQIVIDLKGRREFRAFSLPPSGGKPDRVVIDIIRGGGTPPPIVEPAPLAAADLAVPGGEAGLGGSAAGVAAGGVSTPAHSSEVQVAAAGRVVPLVDGESGETAGAAVATPADDSDRANPPEADVAPVTAAGDAAADAAVEIVATETEPDASTLPEEGAGFANDDEPFVVIIDPGHGGNDPGAIRGSLQEKDICLDIGREMARQLEKIPGYRVVLTRDRDRFVPLGKRVEIARQQKGDVFVSVHCNTHPRPAVSGMEVYFLSLQGATDREARELADKENAAGLVGLTPGEEHADLVVDILMDLKMTRVLQDSGRLAASLLTAADRSGVVAGRRVKQAGFQVLKNLAMPSALVEVAYLSNQEDYRLLGDASGRRRLANAIVAGIQDWRAGTAPARSRTAPVVAARSESERWETMYRVRSGDSLWKLADRYGTTMNEIARRNNLSVRQRELRIGQRLRLPGAKARP